MENTTVWSGSNQNFVTCVIPETLYVTEVLWCLHKSSDCGIILHLSAKNKQKVPDLGKIYCFQNPAEGKSFFIYAYENLVNIFWSILMQFSLHGGVHTPTCWSVPGTSGAPIKPMKESGNVSSVSPACLQPAGATGAAGSSGAGEQDQNWPEGVLRFVPGGVGLRHRRWGLTPSFIHPFTQQAIYATVWLSHHHQSECREHRDIAGTFAFLHG